LPFLDYGCICSNIDVDQKIIERGPAQTNFLLLMHPARFPRPIKTFPPHEKDFPLFLFPFNFPNKLVSTLAIRALTLLTN
ncbi:hypothetical protein PSY30_23555, partial [Shigella flexneri]|nr:hypothetical protein [Shigella flexneri]